MICKNCENNFEGKFCNNCGQKANTERVNFKYLIDEISNSFFQVNRGIFYTIKELSIRPGKSIRDYLNGKRKLHYKPIAYILLTSTIYVLVSYFIGEKSFLGDALSGALDATKENVDKSVINNIFNWLSKNLVYAYILLIPFFSLASYFIFLKSKNNYFEHLILNVYISGQQTIIYLLFSLLYFPFKNKEDYFIALLPTIISILYLFWTYIHFFNTKNTLLSILLTIFTYILFAFIIAIIFIILLAISTYKN